MYLTLTLKTIVLIRRIVGKPNYNKQCESCTIRLISAIYLFNWLKIRTFESLSNVSVLLISSVSYINTRDKSQVLPDLIYQLLYVLKQVRLNTLNIFKSKVKTLHTRIFLRKLRGRSMKFLFFFYYDISKMFYKLF